MAGNQRLIDAYGKKNEEVKYLTLPTAEAGDSQFNTNCFRLRKSDIGSV
jgi:hypothetical protein